MQPRFSLAPSSRLLAATAFALVLGGALGLSGCGSEAAPVASAPVAAATAPVEAESKADSPRDRAAAALKAERLFAPRGDNAFELYLDALTVDPQDALARNALVDLMPYAVMQVEQRLAAQDVREASRLLDLVRRADANAPAIPRLTQALKHKRTQLAQAHAASEAAQAVAQAAPTTPAPAAQAVREEPKTVVRAPTKPSASPKPSEAVAAAPQAAPAARPALFVATASTLPAAISQVPARYPPQAQRRGIEGRVELQFTIGTDGRVSDVSVVTSVPAGVFDREAIGAMQRWRFAPPSQAIRGHRAFDFKLAANSAGANANRLARD